MQLNVVFRFKREAKGAVRYDECDASGKQLNGDEDGALIGTLHLRKTRLGGAVPQGFTVTVNTGGATGGATGSKARSVRVVKS